MSKYLSRKFLTIFAVGIADFGIANGSVPAEIKPLLLGLITGLGGVYVIVEGILDLVRKIKGE